MKRLIAIFASTLLIGAAHASVIYSFSSSDITSINGSMYTTSMHLDTHHHPGFAVSDRHDNQHKHFARLRHDGNGRFEYICSYYHYNRDTHNQCC